MIPKFRLFDKNLRLMLDVHVIDFYERSIDCYVDDLGVNRQEVYSYEMDENNYALMQSTGLHDKNGKEIFEGDILEIKDHPYQRSTGRLSGLKTGIEIDGYYLIQYDREIAGYVVGNWKTREVIRYCTVIGNIHEHPGLLEENDE